MLYVLVELLIDGKSVGLFILDTGASGLVIMLKVVKMFGFCVFGEVYVFGVFGCVFC